MVPPCNPIGIPEPGRQKKKEKKKQSSGSEGQKPLVNLDLVFRKRGRALGEFLLAS